MKKKLVSILLIVVIVFNFILCNYAYASDLEAVTKVLSRYGGNSTINGEALQSLIKNGTDSSGTTMTEKNFGVSLKGVILQQIACVIDVFPMVIQTILTIFTYNPIIASSAFSNAVNNISVSVVNNSRDYASDPGIQSAVQAILDTADDAITSSMLAANAYHYTIEKTVFNEVAVFNINVFNQDDTYINGEGDYYETIPQNNLNLKLKESVTGWYYTIRLLAMMINLCILIYCGIRMAVSTIASEEAKYKKMLLWWAESMIMLFCLHYIIYALIYIGELLLNIINMLRIQTIENGTAVTFEDMVLNSVYLVLVLKGGSSFFLYSLFFWFLTFLQVKFFFTYLKRTFTVMFLVVISPLITVTFPIDKFGNGKAEAYEMWLKELVINIVIQPIHAIIYLVFVYTAGKIAETVPFVAMIFLLSLGRVENIIRNIFKITDSVDNVTMSKKG